jgi:hypothetical protein
MPSHHCPLHAAARVPTQAAGRKLFVNTHWHCCCGSYLLRHRRVPLLLLLPLAHPCLRNMTRYLLASPICCPSDALGWARWRNPLPLTRQLPLSLPLPPPCPPLPPSLSPPLPLPRPRSLHVWWLPLTGAVVFMPHQPKPAGPCNHKSLSG